MKKYLIFLVCLLLMGAYGCASVVNPYSESFTCPLMEEGKCVPIKEAYNESLKGYTLKLEETKDAKNLTKEYDPVQESYRTALFDKLTKLLRDPKTPILAPPKIVRVMILPYQDSQGKEFYSTRYIYLVVEDPQWILQNINTLPSEESEQ